MIRGAALWMAAGAGLMSAGCGPARQMDELGAQQASAAPAVEIAGQVDRGRLLLAHYQCGSCHRIPGVAGAAGQGAGSLEHFGRRSYIAGRLVNRPALLAQWIVEPGKLVPGTAMPTMGVSPEDARHMAAYLASLR